MVRKKPKTQDKSQEFVTPDCVRAANAEDELIGFASSLTDIDIKKYDRRWMMRLFYVVKDKRAKTRCNSDAARIICFIFSLMAYNARIVTQYLLKIQNDKHRRVQKITHAVAAAILSQCNYNILPDTPPPPP